MMLCFGCRRAAEAGSLSLEMNSKPAKCQYQHVCFIGQNITARYTSAFRAIAP